MIINSCVISNLLEIAYISFIFHAHVEFCSAPLLDYLVDSMVTVTEKLSELKTEN